MKHILMDNTADLVLKVHVIGYKDMGESIVVVFWNRNVGKPLYSMVIDMFKRRDKRGQWVNRTFDVLNDYGINSTKLDAVCWSHPDEDHSRGLDDLLKLYCDGETKVFVTYGVHDPDFSKIKHNKNDKLFIDEILKLNKQLKLSCNPVVTSEGETHSLETLIIKSSLMGVNEQPMVIKIEALSPCGGVLSYKTLTVKRMPKNELAMAVMVSIGEARWVFSSDILDEEIERLNEWHLNRPLFVKVPHHGSDSSGRFLTKCSMDKESTIACLTSFDRKHLPIAKIVEQYKARCLRVDFTGAESQEVWGEVEYEFEFVGGGSFKVQHWGNARQIS